MGQRLNIIALSDRGIEFSHRVAWNGQRCLRIMGERSEALLHVSEGPGVLSLRRLFRRTPAVGVDSDERRGQSSRRTRALGLDDVKLLIPFPSSASSISQCALGSGLGVRCNVNNSNGKSCYRTCKSGWVLHPPYITTSRAPFAGRRLPKPTLAGCRSRSAARRSCCL